MNLQLRLKQGLRLNRTTGVSCLVLFVIQGSWGGHHWIDLLRVGLAAFLGLIFFALSDMSLRLIKQFPQTDPLFLEKFSILIPLGTFVALALMYGVSGQLGVGLVLLIPFFQAQLFGHQKLANLLLISAFGLVMLMLGMTWHTIPATIPLVPYSAYFLMAALLLIPLYQHHRWLARIVYQADSHLSKLQSLAATDGLTHLINRRQFNHQLQSEIARAKRHQVPLSLALFDIDDFKKINDFYGHPVGDRILRELGQVLPAHIRESDIPARYGGEEFALILPETRINEAYDIMERLRILLERTVFCLPENPLTLTISIGVAQLDFEHPTALELVERSDAALYEAKKQGKNRVVYGVTPVPKVSFHPSLNPRFASSPKSV